MNTPSLPMAKLKADLKMLVDPIGSKSVIYIDIPVHLNIGDLLINAGVEKMFADYGVQVDLRLTVFDVLRFCNVVKPDHVIVLHGGGNFGDIWPRHQGLREAIIARFPNNRILMYPQSVHFSSDARAREAGAVLRTHPDLHIFVRDRESQAFLAETMDLSSVLCPDTAHQLYGTMPRKEGGASIDHLLFLRRDKEASDIPTMPHVDWEDLVSFSDKAMCGVVRAGFKTSRSQLQQKLVTSAWYAQRDQAIARSSVYFSQYRAVETSRLHGYILSQLLDIPCTPRDNFYGKINRYISTFGDGLLVSPTDRAEVG